MNAHTQAPFLKIVAGTAYAGEQPAGEQPAPKRKARGAYRRDRKPIEYQDGLPIIDPAGEEDRIFRCIADHREAVAHYERCVDVQNEAEGKVSAAEFSHLQGNTKNAFSGMMLWARALILAPPTTRRGLIHKARYLASQITDPDGCASGGPYLPDHMGIDEKPWPLAFLRSLATGLRKMGGEFDPETGKEVRP